MALSTDQAAPLLVQPPLRLIRENRLVPHGWHDPRMDSWNSYVYAAHKYHEPTKTNIKFSLTFPNEHHCDITSDRLLPANVTILLSIMHPSQITEYQTGRYEPTHTKCGINFDEDLQQLPVVRIMFHGKVKSEFGARQLIRGMYNELECAPSNFGGLGGRFAVKVEEGTFMYPHFCVIQRFSPKLKSWMEANNDGLCDGRALSVPCSAAGFSAVMDLLYLDRLPQSLVPLAHEMIDLADQWLMVKVLDRVMRFMKTQVPLLLDENFELLLRWFVSVSRSSGNDIQVRELQKLILVHLTKLAGTDAEKRSVIKDQLREFWKASEDEGLELVLKLTETSN